MTLRPPDDLIQERHIPDGRYDLTVERHRKLVEHTWGSGTFGTGVGAAAHPIFAHLASHCGKGWTFDDFLENTGSRPSDALVFAGGTFSFDEALTVGAHYAVHAQLDDVVRKSGRRAGTFDLVTVSHRLADDAGRTVVTTTETTLVPRRHVRSGPPVLVATPYEPRAGARTWDVGPVRFADIVGIMELMEDTNPVHVDADLALRAGYRGPVNQGPANLAYVFTALAQWRGGVSDLRAVEFRFLDTVTEGDLLRVHGPADIAERVDAELVLAVVGGGAALRCRVQF